MCVLVYCWKAILNLYLESFSVLIKDRTNTMVEIWCKYQCLIWLLQKSKTMEWFTFSNVGGEKKIGWCTEHFVSLTYFFCELNHFLQKAHTALSSCRDSISHVDFRICIIIKTGILSKSFRVQCEKI